ncbi:MULTISPECIES: DUF885 domain-containing protein [unclassified Sphingopyxis]|uniref:DUF885 domain-containing protein n=1 Tax=unclassified Sphingopyxis TaxID=2614943 RepID=UPI00073796DC|nr:MULTISPECIES: DUF885 domain-containing protein [unclassified Sphingopyxis]KTE34638.1 hypothetical protein ATE62_16015 [Sphingopyxis sp. HIX]KTE75039.1 hypothetical protein ATE72_21390 [Sphingopyxis sp. HXXIV]
MQLNRREFSLALGATMLAAAPAARAAAQRSDAAFTAFLDAAFEVELQLDPEQLTGLGRKEQQDRFTDPSDAGAEARLAWRRASVAEMKKRFDRAALSEDARVSYDMWALELERAEASTKWRGHAYIFDRNGPHTGLPNFLINQHRVDSPADMEAYAARVTALGPTLDIYLDRAKASAAKGIRMPGFAYDQSIELVGRLTSGAPFGEGADNALYADAKAKAAGLVAAGKIDAATADAFTARVGKAMTGSLKPAYDRIEAWLVADRAAAGTEPRGAGALPDGAAYYSAMLRLQTTTDLTADEIHALGLSEVARIRAEMEVLKAKIGYEGKLEDFFLFLRSDDRFYVANDDAGRAAYLQKAGDYLAGMRARLPEQFARLPKADLIVKRVEAFREEPGGAAHYSPAALDGSRPGIYYVHLADTRATPIYEIEGTTYHEGHPGHHMQIALAQEMTGTPDFRKNYFYGAYGEGWALYVERLAKEMGFYTDPYSDFGRLGREIWRAIRLVVDTGIHAKGWSDEQAFTYYSANSPQPVGKIRSEIRRYFVTPGQATSYKVGMQRILALREKAKAALGDRYDQKMFHEIILGRGSVPLPVLEAQVDRWIAGATI